MWSQIIDHKWNVSNNLQRDIGLRVAAIDYIENFHTPHYQANGQMEVSGFYNRTWQKTKKLVRAFFEASGKSLNY